MALIKEDGTGLPNSNAYANQADADAFQVDRGLAAWAEATVEVKEAALVRATDYIEGRWALIFQGTINTDTQALSWPRTSAVYPRSGNDFPIDEVPLDVVNGCIQYADQIIGPEGDELSAMTELSVTPQIDETGKTVSRLREKVDVLEEETEYAVGGSSGGSSVLRTIRPIPDADRLIRRWLRGHGLRGLTVRV